MDKHILTGKFKDECTDREKGFIPFVSCKLDDAGYDFNISIWVSEGVSTQEILENTHELALLFLNSVESLQEILIAKDLFEIRLDISSIHRIEVMLLIHPGFKMSKEVSNIFEKLCELLIEKIVEKYKTLN